MCFPRLSRAQSEFIAATDDVFQNVAHENFVTDFIDFLYGSFGALNDCIFGTEFVIGTGLIIFVELIIVDGAYR